MKFSELKIKVPSLTKIEGKYKELTNELHNASSAEEAYKTIKKAFKLDDAISSDLTIISIKHTIDTLDPKITKASDACDELTPQIASFYNAFLKEILSSKYRSELEKKFGKYYFEMLENEMKIFDDKIVLEMIEQNKLVNQYDSLIASAQIPFNGEVLNLPQLGKYKSSADRKTRIDAAKAYWGFLESVDDKIGEIYDKLVKLRTEMAHKLGYKNFIELGYKKLGRLDYDAEMVKNYRKQIEEVVVPQVQKIINKQKKRINIKNPIFVDLNLKFLTGNAIPSGNTAYLVDCANKMYHEMSKETGEFFSFMLDSELMDLDAKKGKMGGGYMTYIPKYKAPFVFSNSNGTSSDVDTLTHEMGHAFQGYLSSQIKIPAYRNATLETCEIHSMSMEFFAYPWMESFFGEAKDKYIYTHLSDAITFLPYGVSVDEFQHFVYEHPEATHKERCAKWREIEKKYRPYIKYDGFSYLENGGYWVRQSHIFGSPFYYIDYTLAQVVALQFKCEMDKDREKAWKKYVKLLKLGGKYPFLTLLEKVHLRNPFIDGNVKKVIMPQMKILNSIDDSSL